MPVNGMVIRLDQLELNTCKFIENPFFFHEYCPLLYFGLSKDSTVVIFPQQAQ